MHRTDETASPFLPFDTAPGAPDPLDRFRAALARHTARREIAPSAQPLATTPWIAMSLLQKAVRRGETGHALRAAATLLRDAPDRLWRRLGGIAFEDIGVADLPTVGLVTAALGGKRLRQQLGGEWAVASLLVERLCAAPKSRASDDLLMSAEAMPRLAGLRASLPHKTDARLASIAQGAACLHTRALALLTLRGADRRSRADQTTRRGNPSLAFETLGQMGVAPTVVSLAREGTRRTGEVLPLLVALLTQENGVRDDATDDPLPPTTMIGELPGWALDTYTREGRRALGRLLRTDAPIARLVRDVVPGAGRLELFGQVLFRAEGGLMRQRLGGETGERLREQMETEALGLDPVTAHEAIGLMRDSLPLLDALRARVMGGC